MGTNEIGISPFRAAVMIIAHNAGLDLGEDESLVGRVVCDPQHVAQPFLHMEMVVDKPKKE